MVETNDSTKVNFFWFATLCSLVDIMAYLLKGRTVEPEKQPLLTNGSETTFVSMQRLGKHIPAAMDTHAKIEVLLETGLSTVVHAEDL
jgi:hypothetical protein